MSAFYSPTLAAILVASGVSLYSADLPVSGNIYATTPAGSDLVISGTVTNTAVVAMGVNATGATNVFGAPAASTYVGGSNGFPLVFTTYGTERMRIGTNGNVGIGVASPSARLEVRDVPGDSLAIYEPTNNAFAVQTLLDGKTLSGYGAFGGDENRLILQPLVGNVGIGVAPTAKFQIRDYFGDSVAFYEPVNNTFAIQTLIDDHSLNGYGAFGGGENRLILQPLVGNVGVGVLNPTTKLAVAGTISASDAAFDNKVGIGTTSPKGNLHINSGGYAAIGLGEDGALAWYVTKEVAGSFNIWQGAFGSSTNRLNIQPSTGNVGIGVANPTSKLAVAGTICASEVKVTATPADYVFADDYKLRPLFEVEAQVKANRHLPGVPSAQEQIQAGSVSLSEMQRLHLEKIEELTLYAIQADKQIADLKTQTKEVRDLRETNQAMAQRLAVLEAQMKQLLKASP